jgi:hypothetical protein
MSLQEKFQNFLSAFMANGTHCGSGEAQKLYLRASYSCQSMTNDKKIDSRLPR